ncbi:MAG: hypothetical protein EOP50_01860, partial [Sphingobacteriales bacterium]
MKLFSKIFGVFALAAVLVACDKKDALNSSANGNAPRLEANTLALAPAASDSLRNVLTLRWTAANYSANMATKYVIQIDSVGKNFSNPFTRTVTDGNTSDFTAKALNEWMLSRGWAFSVPNSLEARVISSYANNNEPLVSNVIPLRLTPYRTPPRVVVPSTDSLVITGAATGDGWANA